MSLEIGLTLQFSIIHKEGEGRHGDHLMDLEEAVLKDRGEEISVVAEDRIEDGGGEIHIVEEEGVVVDEMDLMVVVRGMEMDHREVLVVIEIEIVVDGGKKYLLRTKLDIKTNFVHVCVGLIVHDLLMFTDLFTVNPVSTFSTSFFYYLNSVDSHSFIYTFTHIINT